MEIKLNPNDIACIDWAVDYFMELHSGYVNDSQGMTALSDKIKSLIPIPIEGEYILKLKEEA